MITLKTLPDATEQEVFDQVVTHLLTQNAKSGEGMECYYRSPAGLKCAAGCLIADDEYDSDKMEGFYWRKLIDLGIVGMAHYNLIIALQRIHDEYESYEWKNKLMHLADEFNLKFNWS